LLQKFDILAINLNPAKILDLSAKPFFPCAKELDVGKFREIERT